MHIIQPKEILFGSTENNNTWIPFTDQVVDGYSKAEIIQHEDHLEFKGNVRIDKTKGWACLRSKKVLHDLSSYKFIELKIKTDGLPYQFQMEHNVAWQKEKLNINIDIVANQWKVMHLEMANFKLFDAYQGIIDRKIKLDFFKCIYRYNILAVREENRDFNFEIEYIKFH